MTARRFKGFYFLLAALNTFASTWFLNFLFFHLRDAFGFKDRQNLWVTAMHGLVYAVAAWQCGKFAQRRGFFASLKVGFSGLATVLAVAALLHSPVGILCGLVSYTVMLLFTWPALEALVSENESQAGVQHNVGLYNTTWASSAAIAYFTGGKLYELLGHTLVFWMPAAIFLLEFLIVLWLQRQKAQSSAPGISTADHSAHSQINPSSAARKPAFTPAIPPARFLQMAWLANPFAYVAINTVIAVMPGIAHKLALSPTRVGLFCSVWMFARLATFVLLWQWRGWHYRFHWLLSSFLLLIGSFMMLLLADALWLIVLAQVFFGFAVGLIYYSSLFYSMDVGGDSQGGTRRFP